MYQLLFLRPTAAKKLKFSVAFGQKTFLGGLRPPIKNPTHVELQQTYRVCQIRQTRHARCYFLDVRTGLYQADVDVSTGSQVRDLAAF